MIIIVFNLWLTYSLSDYLWGDGGYCAWIQQADQAPDVSDAHAEQDHEHEVQHSRGLRCGRTDNAQEL